MSSKGTHSPSHVVHLVHKDGSEEIGFFHSVFDLMLENDPHISALGVSIQWVWCWMKECCDDGATNSTRKLLIKPPPPRGDAHEEVCEALVLDGWYHVPLAHNVRCAFRRLQSGEIPSAPSMPIVRKERIMVGAVVLIEAVGGDEPVVLLTKRGKSMRTFPGLWVLPGGHPDVGEGFIETGIREVMEETGVELSREDLSVFALWESAFPLMIESGPPARHHIVVCMRATFHTTWDKVPLQLETFEVDGAAWLDKSSLHIWSDVDEEKEAVFHSDVERYVPTASSGPGETVSVPRKSGRDTIFRGFSLITSGEGEERKVTHKPEKYDMHSEWLAAGHRWFLSKWRNE